MAQSQQFQPMDFEEHFVKKLQAIVQEHGNQDDADNVLLELLSFQGYNKVVDFYKTHVKRIME